MANKYMKKCSIFLAIKGNKNQNTAEILSQSEWQLSRKQTTNGNKDVGGWGRNPYTLLLGM
jgi:hypothetical protein